MVRLRNALMVVVLATGAFGCAHGNGAPGNGYAHWSIFHCSQCDDFPMPAYGPHDSMMPGSYAGPAPEESTASLRMGTPTSSNAPPANEEAAVPPPDARPSEPANAAPSPPAPPPASNP